MTATVSALVHEYDRLARCCRYTIVKNGPRRLFVPNSAFLTREFMVGTISAGAFFTSSTWRMLHAHCWADFMRLALGHHAEKS